MQIKETSQYNYHIKCKTIHPTYNYKCNTPNYECIKKYNTQKCYEIQYTHDDTIKYDTLQTNTILYNLNMNHIKKWTIDKYHNV